MGTMAELEQKVEEPAARVAETGKTPVRAHSYTIGPIVINADSIDDNEKRAAFVRMLDIFNRPPNSVRAL